MAVETVHSDTVKKLKLTSLVWVWVVTKRYRASGKKISTGCCLVELFEDVFSWALSQSGFSSIPFDVSNPLFVSDFYRNRNKIL